MFVSLVQACVVYTVKKVASFQGARSINGNYGTVRNRTCVQALQTSRKKAARRNWN